MISPNEIKLKAERKYPIYLQSIIQEIAFSKLIIIGDKNPSNSLFELQNEIVALVNQSKDRKGFGFTIEYKTVKTKGIIATQSLPVSIYFDSEKDFLKYLGKEKEVESFILNYKKILVVFPELKDWIERNPLKIIQNTNQWDSILKVCSYFKNNPKPNLYLRELPINVHTKFIETNQSIIKELLDIIIKSFINQLEKDFEKRFNLKYREPLIRFKILDKSITDLFFSGLDDISIPVSQFQNLKLPLKRVIIVENKTSLYTTLTLPKMENAIAIFGSGYGVSNLKNIDWIKELEILYWGDIDVQGFEILSQVRGYFLQTKSILMDTLTFEKFFENDLGTPTNILIELNLTTEEKILYEKVKTNNWRLEQEKIPLEYANQVFNNVESV